MPVSSHLLPRARFRIDYISPFLSSSLSLLQEWAGHSIENIAIVGSSLHEGWTKSIPQEYAELDKTVMPTTIIMDGGGNDVSEGGTGGRRE